VIFIQLLHLNDFTDINRNILIFNVLGLYKNLQLNKNRLFWGAVDPESCSSFIRAEVQSALPIPNYNF